MEENVKQKIYIAGIYARLSVEGDDRKNESIETQVTIAKNFIETQEDIILYQCYTDLGKTGTNFSREGFQNMMQDVRQHRINCIVVKDLSRFGRNHIETGNYIEKIFPFLGVRFIAVTDRFDSMGISAERDVFGVNLKNLVNEMYAKDISMKVKAGKKQKQEQGNYMGGIPAYGYRADWKNGKRILFLEEGTSDIVRKIFELFISGNNIRQISRWLYEQRILRPKEYRKTGHIYQQQDQLLQEWPRDTIKRMLGNPVYMGSFFIQKEGEETQDRKETDAQKYGRDKSVEKAIVSEELFLAAANKLQRLRESCANKNVWENKPVEEDLFSGILVCGNCGAQLRKMVYTKQTDKGSVLGSCRYDCPMSQRMDVLRCEKKRISSYVLSGILKRVLRQAIFLSELTEQQLLKISKEESEVEKKKLEREHSNIEKKIKTIKHQNSEQYVKYCSGELPLKIFQETKEENQKKVSSLQEQKNEILRTIKETEQMSERNRIFLLELLRCDEKTVLTQDILRIFIKKIELYPDRRIRIVFRFRRKNWRN